MRNGILDLLYSNPHGWGTGPSLQEPEVAYQDDAGNLYGYGGETVQRWTPPSDGMSLYDVATAPAKFSVSLAEALSPYGQEGWQVPPVVQEPINALNRLAENSRLPDGSLGIPNPSHPQNQQDVTTGILSMYGGNALNSAVRGGRAALAAAETPDLSLLEAYHAANRLPPVAESGPRPQGGILDHVITGADYAYPAGAHPNFDPPPMADILKEGAANDVPFGPIADVPNVPDA